MRIRKIYSMKKLRQNSGLSIQQLAEKIDVPFSTVQAIESGRGKGFSILTKQKISDFFRLPLLAIFPEEREKFEKIQEGLHQLQMFTLKEKKGEKEDEPKKG